MHRIQTIRYTFRSTHSTVKLRINVAKRSGASHNSSRVSRVRVTSRIGIALSSWRTSASSKTRPPVSRASSARSGRLSEGSSISRRGRLDAERGRRDTHAGAEVGRRHRDDPQRVGPGLLGREARRQQAGIVGLLLEPQRLRRLAGDLQLGGQLGRLRRARRDRCSGRRPTPDRRRDRRPCPDAPGTGSGRRAPCCGRRDRPAGPRSRRNNLPRDTASGRCCRSR